MNSSGQVLCGNYGTIANDLSECEITVLEVFQKAMKEQGVGFK